MNDHELLQGYVQNGAQAAFTQLVERHVDLVYSTAFRLVHDRHLAEDVTQQAFALLARKAGRLGNDTILSAWLYRATRHVAFETMRREARRYRREQLAVEAMNQSTPDEAWRQIAPLLDEAMASLSAADHDAIVLRYFENRSLKEVGAALGASEDAAQKRVTRALERLRTSLTRRGMTVSAGALAAAVAGGAVESAPAGLVATAASVALMAPTSSSFLSHSLHVMATTKIQFIVIAVVVAALSVGLVRFRNQNIALRRELAGLRAPVLEVPHEPATKSKAAKAEFNREELQRLRREHLELLSLRGRVTQLANELRKRQSAAGQAQSSQSLAPEEQEADSILFTAALTNRVNSGQTLVVGGWSKEGMHGYLLATPLIELEGTAPQGRRLTLQSQVVLAPESFWNQIGWGPYKSDKHRSSLAGVLSPEQVDSLLQALKDTKEAEISNLSSATGQDGKRMGFGFTIADDQGSGALMGIDLYPRITPDGQAVDLGLLPSTVSAETAIHRSLKQTAGSTLPEPR